MGKGAGVTYLGGSKLRFQEAHNFSLYILKCRFVPRIRDEKLLILRSRILFENELIRATRRFNEIYVRYKDALSDRPTSEPEAIPNAIGFIGLWIIDNLDKLRPDCKPLKQESFL
jgi:hypothetical protein